MDIIVRKPTEQEIKDMEQCPMWECKPSTFNWFYDSNETFLMVEGDVTIEYEGGEVSFKEGDLVSCPKGLTCIWNVRNPVKRRYILR